MSAGSLNSAQLLMLSGIGPKWHLDQLGKLKFSNMNLYEIFINLCFLSEKTRFEIAMFIQFNFTYTNIE